MQNPLGLAEGIAEQHAGLALVAVGPPPGVYVGKDLSLAGPAINGKAERRLGDEGVARHGFERRTGAIGLYLVVTGRDPDFTLVLQAHLCRTQHVPGRVQAQGHPMVKQALTVGQGLQIDALAQPTTQNACTWAGGQIMAIAGTCMVTVAMGDHGAVHGPPRVDVEITGRAVEAFGAGDDKVHGAGAGLELPVMSHAGGRKFDRKWLGLQCSPKTGDARYLPGTSVSRWLPYARPKFCCCSGRLMNRPLNQASSPSL